MSQVIPVASSANSPAPQILDPCCGGRMFWFNKHDPRATFCDIWAEEQVSLKEVLACSPQKPVFGHTTTKNLKTHWITFYKEEPTV